MKEAFDIDVKKDLLCDHDVAEEGVSSDLLINPAMEATIWGVKEKLLVDSGSQKSCVNLKFYEEARLRGNVIEEIPVRNTFIVTAAGAKSKRICSQAIVPIEVGGQIMRQCCLVVPNLVYSVILGNDWLSETKCVIDYDTAILKFLVGEERKVVKLGYQVDKSSFAVECRHLQVIEEFVDDEVNFKVNSASIRINDSMVSERQELIHKIENVVEQTGLECQQKEELLNVLKENKEVFSDKLGCTTVYEHSFDILDKSSFNSPRYPIPHAHAHAVQEVIDEMLRGKIIEPSSSKYVNPLVVVGKKDGSVRVC